MLGCFGLTDRVVEVRTRTRQGSSIKFILLRMYVRCSTQETQKCNECRGMRGAAYIGTPGSGKGVFFEVDNGQSNLTMVSMV